jgi:hypothetical protein
MFKHTDCNTFSYVGINLMHAKKSWGIFGLGALFNLPTPFAPQSKKGKQTPKMYRLLILSPTICLFTSIT